MPALGQFDAASGSREEVLQSIRTGLPITSYQSPWGSISGKPYVRKGTVLTKSQTSGSGLGPAVPPPPPVDPYAQQRADAAAALAKANADGKASSKRQNENTRSLADQQAGLLDSFGKQRDIKLGNIDAALAESDRILLGAYKGALGGLEGSLSDNDKAESDASFHNIANAVRERSDIAGEVSNLGAGETDLLRSQLQSLRNYASNQADVNRSFFDTLRSTNQAITSLNSDTATGRSNMYGQAEADKEKTFADYYNQMVDTETQIMNIENSNSNINSDSSEEYVKKYADAGAKAAEYAGKSYTRQIKPGLEKWDGQGTTATRELNSNKAAVVNLGAPLKRPEGATLRKW